MIWDGTLHWEILRYLNKIVKNKILPLLQKFWGNEFFLQNSASPLFSNYEYLLSCKKKEDYDDKNVLKLHTQTDVRNNGTNFIGPFSKGQSMS